MDSTFTHLVVMRLHPTQRAASPCHRRWNIPASTSSQSGCTKTRASAQASAVCLPIRAGRDPHRLSVLADALEEAGATGELVAHLRSPGPHVRGCWALDLVLGLA